MQTKVERDGDWYVFPDTTRYIDWIETLPELPENPTGPCQPYKKSIVGSQPYMICGGDECETGECQTHMTMRGTRIYVRCMCA